MTEQFDHPSRPFYTSFDFNRETAYYWLIIHSGEYNYDILFSRIFIKFLKIRNYSELIIILVVYIYLLYNDLNIIEIIYSLQSFNIINNCNNAK